MIYSVDIMEMRQKIFFYGNSLVLAGMQASLRACAGLDVIAMKEPASLAELLSPKPAIIIFDMDAVHDDFLLEHLQAQPDLLLIGIDSETHEVLLTGEGASSIALDQILLIVKSWCKPGAEGGNPSQPV